MKAPSYIQEGKTFPHAYPVKDVLGNIYPAHRGLQIEEIKGRMVSVILDNRKRIFVLIPDLIRAVEGFMCEECESSLRIDEITKHKFCPYCTNK